LPGNSVLETISFEPGVKQSEKDDLKSLKYFVVEYSPIKSIQVLNTEKHVKQLGTDSSKKAYMQETLKILLERHWDKYDAKLAQLDYVKDYSLYMKLKARLWSHTVAKLLSDTASSPGNFDKVHHGMVHDLIHSGGIDKVTNGTEEYPME
jgi:hypothetical protein